MPAYVFEKNRIMKKFTVVLLTAAVAVPMMAQEMVVDADTTAQATPLVLTLEDALKIALSENVSVKVADQEVKRSEYAKKGTYAALYPQIDGSASYQRTIKKQVMYMDFDIPGMSGGDIPGAAATGQEGAMSEGIEVGRWNTWTTGITASMPLVNAQLWKSLKISGQDVELSVEKARGSRLQTVTEVKQAFYTVLLAKESLAVFKEVYDNAVTNFKQTEMRYNAQKASELDYTRSKSLVASAIPNVYDSESNVFIALWQLKAVLGLDLETDIDVSGSLTDLADNMQYDLRGQDTLSLDSNSTMRQIAIQAEQLANTIKLQKAAYIPSLAVAFTYNVNAMTNDFNFSEYKWSPYSYVGISLAIPIFSGGKRLNNVRQTQVQYTELKLQEMNTERQLKIAIRQYLNQMETAMKSFDAASEAVVTADKAYSIASKSYNVGRSTLTDLNDAQLALTQAELNVCQTIYSFVVAKAGLEEVLGADFID